MPEELPQRAVLVDQLVQPVEVAPQALHHHPHHHDLPELQPRPAQVEADPGAQLLLQQCKQAQPEVGIRIQVLQTQQDRRDVVPRLRVEPDLLDPHRAEFELRILYLAHGESPEDSIETARRPPIRPSDYPPAGIFAIKSCKKTYRLQTFRPFSGGH